MQRLFVIPASATVDYLSPILQDNSTLHPSPCLLRGQTRLWRRGLVQRYNTPLFDAVKNFTRTSPGKPNNTFGPAVPGTHPAVRCTLARGPIPVVIKARMNLEATVQSSLNREQRRPGNPFRHRWFPRRPNRPVSSQEVSCSQFFYPIP